MTFCSECGSEVTESQKFCPECGKSLQSDDGSDEPAPETVDTNDGDGFDVLLGLSAGLMGVLVGAVVAFSFTNIGGSTIFFLLTLAGVGYWLYSTKRLPSEAIGSGLYVLALWLVLSPILFYIPVIGNANTDTASGTGAALGGIMGMFIYGFIFLIIAGVMAAIGYFSKKRARNKLGEATL